MRAIQRPTSKLLIACLAAFLISAGVRLIEYPRWESPGFQLDGERLLATPDAYFWVAGAEGLNPFAESLPMSVLLDILGRAIPVAHANLAFWAAILLAALVAVPVVLWGDYLSDPLHGLIPAALGTLAPAFFYRTRLGFYDSDWATLFFPLLISWLLATWIQNRVRVSDRASQKAIRPGHDRFLVSATIILVAFALPWHNFNGIFVIAMLGLAALLIALLGIPEMRSSSYLSLLAITLVVGAGWAGAALGLLLLWQRDRIEMRHPKSALVTGSLLGFLLLAFTGYQFWEYLALAIPAYAGRLFGLRLAPDTDFTLVFPGLAASVRETQITSLITTLEGMAFHPFVGILGMAGYLALLRKKPPALLLAPLLLLGLGSARLGIRFNMFGVPVILLGLLAPLDWLMAQVDRHVAWKRRLKISAAALFCLTLLAFTINADQHTKLETVVDEPHARGLKELGEIAGEGSMLWTWWDYGYASQHFSGMETFADGRRNTGEYLYSLGTVFGSESLARAAGFMRFAKLHDFVPWETWATWDRTQWDAFQAGLAGLDSQPEPRGDAQYLVVQWGGIPALPWIQYFASWDFDAQVGQQSQVIRIVRPLDLDLESGRFHFDEDQSVAVASVDLLGHPASQHYDYPDNDKGPHLLLNNATGEVMLIDGPAYESTFIQLLILPADYSFEEFDFELILEDPPFVRIFQLH